MQYKTCEQCGKDSPSVINNVCAECRQDQPQMTAEQLRVWMLDELDKVLRGIEADRFTMENIWALQRKLQFPQNVAQIVSREMNELRDDANGK